MLITQNNSLIIFLYLFYVITNLLIRSNSFVCPKFLPLIDLPTLEWMEVIMIDDTPTNYYQNLQPHFIYSILTSTITIALQWAKLRSEDKRII